MKGANVSVQVLKGSWAGEQRVLAGILLQQKMSTTGSGISLAHGWRIFEHSGNGYVS